MNKEYVFDKLLEITKIPISTQDFNKIFNNFFNLFTFKSFEDGYFEPLKGIKIHFKDLTPQEKDVKDKIIFVEHITLYKDI